ncbi:hypothetical protein D9757_012185 [Collybiopsis confluens]|uniref:F-box domain-containing protein n=1 Tax=Collybiopsis confluens TaxID=2823264 RepID=A0A8H5GK56_9AGAR|nr:hypothetical protein D9757_012185 [Collybiopsis confluens]
MSNTLPASSLLLHRRIVGPIWLEPKERELLRRMISSVEDEIQSLDTGTPELDGLKAAKLVELSFLHNTLAPVRRLPQELLSQIFLSFCFPERDDKESALPNVFQLARSIDTIAEVGIAWKNAVYATPMLWSAFSFSGRDIWVNDTWLRRWLSLSQGLPLDIGFMLDSIFQSVYVDRASSLVTTILESHSQLRSLRLIGDILIFLPVFYLPRGALPWLAELRLSVGRRSECSTMQSMSAQLPQRVEAFDGISSLRHLKVVDWEEISIMERVTMPLERLESLQLTSYHPDCEQTFYLNALNQCRALETLDLNLLRYEAEMVQNTSCTLHLLKSLTLHPEISSADFSFSALSSLSAPRLENFHIHCYHFICDSQLTQISDFQRRSSFLLKSLILDLYLDTERVETSDMDRFSSLLSLFPSLNCLRLRLPDDCEQSMLSAVLRTLVIRDQLCTTDSESGIIVPRLVEFELAIVGTNERREFPSEMSRMILSRSSSSSHVSGDRPKFSRLEKVTLRGFGSSDDMTMLSGLSDLHLTVEPGSVV